MGKSSIAFIPTSSSLDFDLKLRCRHLKLYCCIIISVSDPFHFDMDPEVEKRGKRGNFHCTRGKKYHFGRGGKGKNFNYLDNIHPWKLFNNFEKKIWYSYGFGCFLWKFSMILADFLLPGTDWPKWNGSGSGSATLIIIINH